MERPKNRLVADTPDKLNRRFGDHVRRLRTSRGLTQEELAERAELSVDAIRRIERGAFSPSLETLSKLAFGLELSLKTLFGPFGRERTDLVAELCDYLSGLSGRQVSLAWRVLHAMFEEKEG
jgi:transcriptional regulator with XRE-family HTH domain